MAVVKNLMVRIGADVRGLINGMKNSSSATTQASSNIKRSTSGMRRSVKESFSTARMSVKEYSQYVSKTKQDHFTASQNVERLTDKMEQLTGVYDTVRNATKGLDLTKPLAKQIADTEAQLEKVNEKIRLTKIQLDSVGRSRSAGKNVRIEKLRSQLDSLIHESDLAGQHLYALDQAADMVGADNMQFATAAGLKNLKTEIHKVTNELDAARLKASKTADTLRSMGVAPTLKYILKNIGTTAAKAAGGGVKVLARGLMALGGGVLKRIGAIPGRLLHIGKSASAGTGGLNRMVRSIRNIGAVSLGLRIATGVFGRLRSVISSYISQNEELNASVTSLRNQMGEALLPAINIVIVAMQRLMPAVQAVANAVNAIFTTLFGNVKSTTAAISQSATDAGKAASGLETYGFDQITKVSDDSDSSTGGTSGSQGASSEQSALVQQLTGWLDQIKAAFVAGDWKGLGQIVGNGINAAVDAINAVEVGGRAGTFANNVFTALNSALTTINLSGIGAKAGQMLTSGLQKINFKTVGSSIGKAFTAVPAIVVGFIQNTNWGVVAKSLSTCLSGALSSISEWIGSVDWLKIGNSIWTFISNIDYGAIAKGLFSFLGSALGAAVGILWGFISSDVKEYFTEKIQACGGNVAQGLLDGILGGLANIGAWIINNIFSPFIQGFKRIFGIHSPSTVMEEQGGFLALGLLNGLSEKWKNVLSLLSEGLATLQAKLSEAWSNCRAAAAQKWTEISSSVSGKLSELRSSIAEKVGNIRQNCSDAWTNMKSDAISHTTAIKTALVEGWTNCRTETAQKWTEISSSVSGKISEMRASVNEKVGSIRQNCSDAWASMKSDATSHANAIKTNLSEGWANCRTATAQKWTEISSAVGGRLAEMKSSASEKIGGIRQACSNGWGGMKSDATSAVTIMANQAVSGFLRMKQGIVDAFSGVWSGIRGWINKVISGVESMVNLVIKGINGMIESFNKIASVGSYFGMNLSISKITAVSLPRLATGGITDGPTAAIIGEAGKEAVLPLENNTGWMDQLVQKIVEVSGGGGTPVTLQIVIGGRKVTEYFIKDINKITKTTGVCPIKV